MSRRRATGIFGDVTLNDFANATPKRGNRLKKTINNAMTIREELSNSHASKTSEDVSWFDKDVNEFDVNTYFTEDNRVSIDDAVKKTVVSRSRRRRAAMKTPAEDGTTVSACEDNDGGYEYPLHVWFLLAEYIRLEDVVRFSCICRSACMATSVPRFWITLYRRYYNEQIKVPERLTPLCMERPRGLKACVVRTLFLAYPPFVERARITLAASSESVDVSTRLLLRSYCVLAWNKQSAKSHWDFHFKFQKRRYYPRRDTGPSSKSRLPDLLEFLSDIDANEEDGCRVLKVTCPHYVAVPALMGMFMTAVSLTGDKVHQRLRLTFSRNAYCQPSRHQNEDDVMIVFEPASGVHVLDWWHPQYPYFS